MRILFLCFFAGLSLAAYAQDDGVAEKIRAAMAGDIRTEADVARDRNRKPLQLRKSPGKRGIRTL